MFRTKVIFANIHSHCRRLATFRSIIPDVEISKVSYPKFVLDHTKDATGTAMICARTGKTVSYSELKSSVKSVSSGLVKSGLNKNDVLCIYSPNCVEYPIAIFGTMMAGGVVTTANPAYTAEELTYQLQDSKTKFILTAKENFERAAQAVKNCNTVKEIIVIGDDIKGIKNFSKLLEDNGSADRSNDQLFMDPTTTVAALLYSSGTTGLPKGVMLTHQNLVGNMSQCYPMADVSNRTETLSGVLPFFHVFGQVPILAFTFMTQNKIVIHKSFDPVEFLTCIEKYRISIMHLVPPIILFMINHPMVDKYNLSSIERVVCGAAPLKPETEELFKKKFPNVDLSQGYGLTETSPVITIAQPKELRNTSVHSKKVGAAGLLLPNQEVKFVHPETKEELGVGEQGELVVKGVQIMKGYLNKPEATASCIKDGWFYTGDIGYIDEDGYVFIVDRLKELIKVKGMQVAPAELEGILSTHPSVQDAAVIGKQDDRSGEVPVAFVVLKKDTNETEQSIYNWMASRVAKHKNLDGGIFFTDAIPKAASGKILRRILKEKIITK